MLVSITHCNTVYLGLEWSNVNTFWYWYFNSWCRLSWLNGEPLNYWKLFVPVLVHRKSIIEMYIAPPMCVYQFVASTVQSENYNHSDDKMQVVKSCYIYISNTIFRFGFAKICDNSHFQITLTHMSQQTESNQPTVFRSEANGQISRKWIIAWWSKLFSCKSHLAPKVGWVFGGQQQKQLPSRWVLCNLKSLTTCTLVQ